ncbi:MAG: hypothetical protein IH796_07455 [Deltaproteobacteria bacterium]|nr:hypothetical protein [Deltaproteobacteria bacterium]
MKGFRIGLWLLAGLAGAIVFWLFQFVTGPSTITAFMGQQIVTQGGYTASWTVPIGWGIHLGVSLAYSFLFALIMLPLFVLAERIQLVLGLVIGAALGWVATLITVPAITVTISVLGGKGFPANLPGLNTAYGLPFWNHMLFFVVVWLIYLFIPYQGRKF